MGKPRPIRIALPGDDGRCGGLQAYPGRPSRSNRSIRELECIMGIERLPTKVLLVADDRDDWMLTRDLLSSVSTRRYELEWVSDYHDALGVTLRGESDICLLGEHIGGRNGLEFLNEVLAGGAKVPVILLTGQEDHYVAEEALEIGASDCLTRGEINISLLEHSIHHAIRQKRREESIRRWEEHCRPVLDSSSETLGIFGTALDAMEQQRAKECPFSSPAEPDRLTREHTEELSRATEALQRRESFIRSVFDGLSASICILDDQGCIFDTNEPWLCFAQANGMLECLFLGVNYLNVCDHAEGAWAEGADDAAAGIREVIAGVKETFELEYPCHSPDEDRWFIMRAKRFRDHEPVQVVVAHENITERKKAEDVLRLHSLVLDQIQDHVVVTDMQGRLLYVNDSQCAALKRSREELIGQSVETFGDDPTRGATQREILEQTLAHGQWRGEVTNFALDGSESVVDVRTTMVRDEQGHALACCGVGTDITDRKRAEEELQKFKQIISHTPDGIALLDREYRYKIVNDAYEISSGVERDRFIGLTVAEYLGEDFFRKYVKEPFDRCLAGETINYQTWAQYPSLGRRFVDVTYFPYIDSRGHIAGIVADTRDITEKRLVEEALLESEARFRSIYENSIDGIFFARPDGPILAANPAACRILGYTEEEIIRLGRSGLMEAETPDFSRLIEERSTTGQCKGEITFVQKDGTRFPVEISSVIFEDGQGELRSITIFRDVREQVKAREELRASEAWLRRTFDQAPIGAAINSMDYRFLRVNQEFCRFTGYSEEELTSMGFAEITHPDDLAVGLSQIKRLEAGEIEHYEVDKRYIQKNGCVVWGHLSVRILKDAEGSPLCLLPMVVDISEQKRAEAEILEKKELLQAQALHLEEANTALRVLLDRREEEKHQIVEEIHSNIRHLILPYVEKVKNRAQDSESGVLLGVIQANLDLITTDFLKTLPAASAGLTPTEMKVADLVRHGKSNKEIAELLTMSVNAVAFHRKNIRKKLGLKREKINLQSFLNSSV
jgi:PAS domain S-box-containing protein